MESFTSSRFLDEDSLEQGKELFGHHGVIYHNSSMSDDETPSTGSLSVVQYTFGKCIEWKASEVCVDADSQEQEWAMVSATRKRTVSGSLDTLGCRTSLKIPLSDIKGYKVLQKKTRLILVPKDSPVQHFFYFQFGNSDGLTQILKSFITSRRSKQDRKFYVIVGEKGVKTVPKSFSDLSLAERHDTVWNFVSNLKDRPYETTLSTFSKFSEYLLYKPHEVRQSDDEEVVGDLVSSMEASAVEDGGFSLVDSGSPPRPLPSRGSPLDPLQWAAAADPVGRISNPDHIKQIIFRGGCEPSIRFETWKFLLGYYPWNSTSAERLELKKQKVDDYFRMKLQWKSLSPDQEARFSAFRERKSLIEKDVYRTDRTMAFFAGDSNPNLALLSDILTTYAMYNFDLGYVQGMSDLLSPILFLMANEVDAFWCFVGFMDKVYRNFDEDQAGMKKQLSQLSTLLSAAEPQLSEYLDQKESGNLFFCFRWLLVWFKREFSHQDIMTLWEVLWTELPCMNFHLVICVAILESEKRILMERNYGFTEILKHFNELSGKLDVDDLLSRAEGVYLSLCSATDRLTAATRRVLGLSSTPATTSSEEEQDDPPSSDNRLEQAFEQDWPIINC